MASCACIGKFTLRNCCVCTCGACAIEVSCSVNVDCEVAEFRIPCPLCSCILHYNVDVCSAWNDSKVLCSAFYCDSHCVLAVFEFSKNYLDSFCFYFGCSKVVTVHCTCEVQCFVSKVSVNEFQNVCASFWSILSNAVALCCASFFCASCIFATTTNCALAFACVSWSWSNVKRRLNKCSACSHLCCAFVLTWCTCDEEVIADLDISTTLQTVDVEIVCTIGDSNCDVAVLFAVSRVDALYETVNLCTSYACFCKTCSCSVSKSCDVKFNKCSNCFDCALVVFDWSSKCNEVASFYCCSIFEVVTVDEKFVAFCVDHVEGNIAVLFAVSSCDFVDFTNDEVTICCCGTIFKSSTCIKSSLNEGCSSSWNCNLECYVFGSGTACDCSNYVENYCFSKLFCNCKFAISNCSVCVCAIKSPSDCCTKYAFCWELDFVASYCCINKRKVVLSHLDLFSICVSDFTDVGNGVSGVWVNLECLGVNGDYTREVYLCTNFDFFVQLEHCSFVDEVDCVVKVEFYITTRKCEVVVNLFESTICVVFRNNACDCSIFQCNTAVLVSSKSCIFVGFSSSKSSCSINVRKLSFCCCVTCNDKCAVFVKFVLAVVSCNCTCYYNFGTNRPLSAKLFCCFATFGSTNWSVCIVTVTVFVLDVQRTLRGRFHANYADNVTLDTDLFARTGTIVSLASSKVFVVCVKNELCQTTFEADRNRFAVNFVSNALFVYECSCQCVSNVLSWVWFNFDCLLVVFVFAEFNIVCVTSSNVNRPLNVCSFASGSNEAYYFVSVSRVAVFVHLVEKFFHAFECFSFQRWSTCCKQHGNAQHHCQDANEK